MCFFGYPYRRSEKAVCVSINVQDRKLLFVKNSRVEGQIENGGRAEKQF